MSEKERIAKLEHQISELATRIRRISSDTGLAGIDELAAFSSGSCTNTCTASCTIGCTKGCTGSCVAGEFDDMVAASATTGAEGAAPALQAAVEGRRLFDEFSK